MNLQEKVFLSLIYIHPIEYRKTKKISTGQIYFTIKLNEDLNPFDFTIPLPKYIEFDSPINRFLITSSIPQTYPAKTAKKKPPKGRSIFERK